MNRVGGIGIVPVLIACLVFVGGCGGGGSSAGAEVEAHAEAITKAEFVKQASLICLAAKERASEEFEIYLSQNKVPSAGPGMIAKANEVVDEIFGPVFELQVEKIRAIGAPADDVAQVSELLTAMQQGAEEAKEEPLQFIRKGTALNHASRLAEAYGLKACSNGNV
jgi:hypothetical protein